ncbi:MAG: DUF1592 domain-containing protein [Myxococcaceae bacterium]|nr:DUF1592 domain-containing protein [Myxococcaceae bacterium]
MRRLLPALLLAACEGTISDVKPPVDPNGPFPVIEPKCDVIPAPGVTPLAKLSTLQYRNTVRDLLGTSGLAALATELSTRLDAVPDDSDVSFRTLDNRVTDQHLTAWFEVARGIGDSIEATPARLTALAGSCAVAATLTPGCVNDFLNRFGRRALRRPLTATELTELSAFNDGVRRPAEAIRAMVIALLMSPRFVSHVEIDGAELGSARRLDLSPYELAARLSYTYWQTLPDDALLDAAADGSLATEAGYRAQVERVFADPRTKTTLWVFWREWLRLEKFTGFATTRPAFAALAAGERLDYTQMVDEVHALTDRYTFDAPGTFGDLVASDVSVTRSADLAKLYGTSVWNGAGEPPRFTNRKGLFQRAALLVDGLEQTNPFHRGAMTRRAFLCDSLPSPDPTTLPPGSLDPPPFNAMSTTRQRFEAKVAGNTLCQGCHGSFSDLGYVLEQFDALGRHRTKEKVFDEASGALLAELNLDTSAVAKVELGDLAVVSGPDDLTAKMISSGKPQRCFAKTFSTFALRREPVIGTGEHCSTLKLGARTLTMADVFRGLAYEPSFKERTVGEP